MVDAGTRQQLLLEAVVSTAEDLSLDGVLRRIVRAASDLAGAKYAAMGVLAAGPERRLRDFITHGLSPEQADRIGRLPRGHGLLGLIIDRPTPLRLHEIAQHPESFGFPPHHPPMSSFLGVPVRIRDRVFGNLYLTEKEGGGDFTDEDEAVVVALAAAAGVAIENARLYEEASRRELWLEATTDVTAGVLGRLPGHQVLQGMVDRALEIACADLVAVALVDEDGSLGLQAVAGVEPAPRVSPDPRETLAGRVLESGDAVVIDDLRTDPTPAADLRDRDGWPTVGPVVVLPLRTPDGVEGVLTLAWTPDHAHFRDDVDLQLPQRYAEQVALALQAARARSASEKLSVFEDRDRIGRDLHDLVIQQLFAIGLGLENTARMIERPTVAQRVATAVDDIDATIKDIRRTIFALSVAQASTDVRAALGNVVEQAAAPLAYRPTLRFAGPVDALVDDDVKDQLVAVLREALSNAARHAGATRIEVLLEADESIRLTVSDDGRGLPPAVVRSGLANLEERAARLGGRMLLESAAGRGTTLQWEVPAGPGRSVDP
ncbi:GAF domain-containing protein [Nocardioides sp.]|uniref:sensor histidine kinase n=1 Tax=Nocardioides sp. TaxID=35761 RepID=UPI002732F39C|nr:GAF domain-containing protein [Nocardioides sp.]MDP3890208.1 GAF domain-containing protein [Nocardioides sp.]